MKTLLQKIASIFSNAVFYFSIFIFIIAFNFAHNPPGGWYQQFLPDLNGQMLSDVIFIDSLNGFAITDNDFSNDTGYIVKTSDGGNNWNIVYQDDRDFKAIEFIDLDTGYACGADPLTSSNLLKTTNAGLNWFDIHPPGAALTLNDIEVLNSDTMWLAASSGFDGGVFRTTNGGVNWIQQLNLGSNNPDRIYMFNSRIGFITQDGNYIRKTTDGGQSWFVVLSGSFTDMFFADSLTGWRSYGTMRKTTDGGLSWVTQAFPQGGNIVQNNAVTFSNVNEDTIWAVGGYVGYPPNRLRGIIYKTTNSGINWGYQIPDTSMNIFRYYYSQFVNRANGWSYTVYTGLHTVTGGDSVTFYTGINESNIVNRNFMLHQNYPNPFNPKTKIKYELLKGGYVKLKVFDISGKQVVTLVSKKQNAGSYEVEFNGDVLPSGIYFYEIEVTANNDFFTDTKKMILIH